MNLNETYAARGADVAAENFDGEYVVLDLASGKYFSLAGGSALVWRALMAGHSVESLTAGLGADDPRRAGVTALVTSLVEHDLLRPQPPSAPPPAELVAELVAAPAEFGLEVFDDLADLLIADPIHDVDEEAGWPHMPPKDGR